jgi:putative peptidoglycan lipid II flippase
MGLGMIVGNLFSLLILVLGTRTTDLRYKPRIDLADPHLRRFFILLGPVMLSSIVVEINQIIDRNLASSLASGTVSALNYASKVNNVFSGLMGASIGVAFYPKMSELAAAGDTDALKAQVVNGIKLLLPMLVPLALGLILLAEPLIRLLLERGAFRPEDTARTAQCLRLYAIGLLAGNLNPLLSRAYYARQKTRLVAILSTVSVAIGIALDFLLIGPLQARGLALATSVSGTVSFILFFTFLRRALGSLQVFSSRLEWLKFGLALAAMSGLVWLGKAWLPLMAGSYQQTLFLTVGLVAAAALVYLALMFALRTETSRFALQALGRWRDSRRTKTTQE